MTEIRHPDIEIYVKNCTPDAISNWLAEQADSISAVSSKGQNHQLVLTFANQQVPVMIQEKVAGKAWTSVWFKKNETPWLTDLSCARNASEGLETQIRCIASGWNDGDDPDEYWKVENGSEEKIQWRT